MCLCFPDVQSVFALSKCFSKYFASIHEKFLDQLPMYSQNTARWGVFDEKGHHDGVLKSKRKNLNKTLMPHRDVFLGKSHNPVFCNRESRWGREKGEYMKQRERERKREPRVF